MDSPEEPPILAVVLAGRIVALVRDSGASHLEAACALKAAGHLVQALPLSLMSEEQQPPVELPRAG